MPGSLLGTDSKPSLLPGVKKRPGTEPGLLRGVGVTITGTTLFFERLVALGNSVPERVVERLSVLRMDESAQHEKSGA
jgi:hypothetical protein